MGLYAYICMPSVSALKEQTLSDVLGPGLLLRSIGCGDVGGVRILSLQNMTEYEVSI